MSKTIRPFHHLYDDVLLRSLSDLREVMEVIGRRDPELSLPSSREIRRQLDELEVEVKYRALGG